MNLVLHGVEDFRIEQNDTLRNPAFTGASGTLATFDCVIANPPFKEWGREVWEADPWGRAAFGLPPPSYGDYAWVQQMVASMAQGRPAPALRSSGWCGRGRRRESDRLCRVDRCRRFGSEATRGGRRLGNRDRTTRTDYLLGLGRARRDGRRRWPRPAGGGGCPHGRAVARRNRAARLRRSGALDITVATSAEVEANRHDPCCCIHDALREGRVLYHVADAPPLDTE